MYKINESQISRLKGKTCVQKPLLPDESSCEASGQAILRLAQNMTESFLLLLERLLGNAVLRRRAWPQWEMPRDCSRWKVAPKAQPVSMLFTFFESCWGGKKKKSSHLHQFSALANMTQAEYLQRSSTWPNQGKIWGSLSWEASHYPQWEQFPSCRGLHLPIWSLKILAQEGVSPRPSWQRLLNSFPTPELNTWGTGNSFRGSKEHTKLLNSYST